MSEKIIATVCGREITEAEFNAFVERIPAEQKAYIATAEGRHQALAQYCNYFLFEKYGQDQGYETEEEFVAMLEGVKRELIGQYALTKLVKDIDATEEECRTYYEANLAQFQVGPKAQAKHILVETEEACQKVLKEIESGEKTFEEAAAAYSTCPSKAQGGDLGSFGRGQMVKEFDEAVFSAEVGKVLGPVQTQFGYHLIRVDALDQGSTASFAQAATQIRQHLVNEKQNKVYMETRAQLIEKYGLSFAE